MPMHMPLFQAVIMGVLQGLAEFAPISSSAHLVLFPWLVGPGLTKTGWITDPGQAFDAALHIGTAIALIIYFWGEWAQIISAWWGSVIGKQKWESVSVRMAWLIIVASVPGALFGKLFEKKLETLFDVDAHKWAPAAIAIFLILMGGVLWLADHYGKKARTLAQVTMVDAIVIGLSQALALFPGVSRSGATITAGLAMGLKRDSAARFSFLMATPITLGAGLLKVFELRHSHEAHPQASALVIGIITSAIVGYAVIRWFLTYLQRQNLNLFVLYRIVFGLIVLIIWWMRK